MGPLDFKDCQTPSCLWYSALFDRQFVLQNRRASRPSPSSSVHVSPPWMYLKCTMTTCHAQLYAPAAKQKGSFPISDQRRACICVHLLSKEFTATVATWRHKVVACVHVRASACMCWVNECICTVCVCVCVCVCVSALWLRAYMSRTLGWRQWCSDERLIWAHVIGPARLERYERLTC